MTSSRKSSTVLHVIDTTGPGGAETVFITLAKACQEQGYRSLAVIRGPGWVEDQLIKNGIEYVVLDCKGSFNLSFLYKLAVLVVKNRVATIQSHLLGSNLYASIVAILTRRKLISTFHGHVDISPTERLLRAKLFLIGLGSNLVVAVTKDLGDSISRMGDTRLTRKTRVIANGIDTSIYRKVARKELTPESLSAITFGCLGNVRKAKNYRLAIRFVHFLKQRGVDAKLKIAGDDTNELARELKGYCQELSLADAVTFCGFVEDVPAYFDSFDVFLMTSSSEGHPLAINQALSAGTPVLTTPNGVEKIIPTRLLAVSEGHSPEALYDALKQLIDHETSMPDSSKERRLYIEQFFSEAHMAKEYFKYYGI